VETSLTNCIDAESQQQNEHQDREQEIQSNESRTTGAEFSHRLQFERERSKRLNRT
jgi:hypothetical protein